MAGSSDEKRSNAVIMVIMVVIMMVIAGAGAAGGGDQCGEAIQEISSCLHYLRGGKPVPQQTVRCCTGVNNIYAEASTTPLLQSLCTCLKAEAIQYDLNDQALQSLAPTCGVKLNFKFSKNIDCSKIYI